MKRSILVLLAVLFLPLVLGAGATEEKTVNKQHGKAFFGQPGPWTVHVHVSAAGWGMMQPDQPMTRGRVLGALAALGRGFAPPATQPAAVAAVKRQEGERIKAGSFGYQFAYVKSTVEIDGEKFQDVGVRLKGNGSYSASRSVPRRPFKLDFKRFVEGRKFHGMTTINFANNAWDTSQLRETLSYEVFRQAGLVAPRTTLALVYLTVDGLYDKEFVGLYTVVEDVDKTFLKTHFGNADGLLLKPEGVRDLPYLGDDFARYEKQYRPKTPVTPKASARLIEIVKLIHQSDDAAFNSQIDKVMDVDNFLRFIAASALLANMDSFLVNGHNFYMYIDANDNKLRWMPWDLHISLGAFVFTGTGDELMNLSVAHPFMGDNKLIQRVLAVPEYNKKYRQYMRQFATGCFDPQKINARIDALQPLVDKAVEVATKLNKVGSPTTAPASWGRNLNVAPDLKPFIAGRAKSVLEQLDTGKDGYVPNFANRGFGMGGRLELPPADIAIIATGIMRRVDTNNQQVLTLSQINAAIAEFVIRADTAKAGGLDISTLGAALGQALPPPLAGGKAPPVGVRREMALAQSLIRQADTKNAGRVTAADLQALAGRLFSQSDRNRDGALDEVELAGALRQLLTR